MAVITVMASYCVGRPPGRCKFIANAFMGFEYGGDVVVNNRADGKGDTVTGLTMAGNLFLDCKQGCLKWSTTALANPRMYSDHNAYHLAEQKTPPAAFWLQRKPTKLAQIQAAMREGGFIASGQHSQLLAKKPANIQTLQSIGDIAPDSLLDELAAKGMIDASELAVLKRWRHFPSITPADWKGPGSPLAELPHLKPPKVVAPPEK